MAFASFLAVFPRDFLSRSLAAGETVLLGADEEQ
jgi:hypothetical protein